MDEDELKPVITSTQLVELEMFKEERLAERKKCYDATWKAYCEIQKACFSARRIKLKEFMEIEYQLSELLISQRDLIVQEENQNA